MRDKEAVNFRHWNSLIVARNLVKWFQRTDSVRNEETPVLSFAITLDRPIQSDVISCEMRRMLEKSSYFLICSSFLRATTLLVGQKRRESTRDGES